MKKAQRVVVAATLLAIGVSARAAGADPIGFDPSMVVAGNGLGQSSSLIASVAAIAPVPDGGTTLVLLSCALTGIAALRRRLAA